MKKVVCILSLLSIALASFARHSKGGYLVYEYLGEGTAANSSQYRVTVVHYVNCLETEFELGSVIVGIYQNGSFYKTVEIARSSQQNLQKRQFSGCINPIPEVCFFLAFYVSVIELPNNASGYVLAEQECCRANGILNIDNSGQVGSTNSNNIPGTINGKDYHVNSSPDIVIKDTAVICHNSPFELDFSATDPDGDNLTYSFCSATLGGTRSDRQPNPPSPPPYTTADYPAPFSGAAPLGNRVTINRKTGLITGIAPSVTGNYTISVCITEQRKGVIIAVTKKEILITVADCTLSAASLLPSYTNCNDYSFTFQNESYSTGINSYQWSFGTDVPDQSLLTQPTPSFTYPDTGTYKIKLTVTSGTNCTDSATSLVKIYPGFNAAFTAAGSCYQSPFLFTDSSYVKWGEIINYDWRFGEPEITDTSNSATTRHQYAAPGNYTASLIITSNKGCVDTATQNILATNKPKIVLPFQDTLICRDDKLLLPAEAEGSVFSWSPDYNISRTTELTPTVYPFTTTVYTLTVQDKQCIDSMNVTVNVIDSVSLQLPSPLTLCATDTVQLQPQTNALYFAWREAGDGNSLDHNNVKNPNAAPLQTTFYSVTASVGHCNATAQTEVFVSPYPTATVSPNLSICFGNTVPLYASTTAAHYAWSPAGSLLGANTLTPLAGPQTSTDYILTISDTFYCTKEVRDTIRVTVIPLPVVDAGNDTAAVVGEPLQLKASANEEASYRWSPTTGMYANDVANPVIVINNPALTSLTYFVTAQTAEGCTGSDSIHVVIYKSKPDIFIPSAFTPDHDGRNDVFRPVTAGISQIHFFRVFNRWGVLLYETSKPGEGWNGWYRGKEQPPGSYVFSVEAVDYTGRLISKQGTVVLLR